MRILIVIPPSTHLIDDRVFPFLGPLQIAAVARNNGHDVSVLDLTGHARRCTKERHRDDCMDAETKRASDEIIKAASNVDLVGCYALVAQYPVVKRLAKSLRSSGYAGELVLGGPHANTVTSPGYEEEAKTVLADGWSHLVHSDQGGGGGEPGFLWLLDQIQSKTPIDPIVRIPSRPPGMAFPNDRWPYPARDLIDMGSYKYFIDGERATSFIEQAGCPYACVSGDSLIATPDRLIRPDTEPMSAEFACGEHTHSRGLRQASLVKQGERECIRLSLSNGTQIDLTPDHPVLAVVGNRPFYVAAESIKPETWVISEVGQNKVERLCPLAPVDLPVYSNGNPRCREIRTPAVFDNDVAWLTGCLIGDGSLPLNGRSSGVHFSLKKRTKEDILTRVKSCFGVDVRVSPHALTTKMENGWISLRAVVSFFTQSVGIDPKYKLRVPRVVFESPEPVVRSFLEGLWAADAYWQRGTLPVLSTISERLARECAALINWIGDGVVLRTYDINDYTKSCFPNSKPHWRVEWHKKEGFLRSSGQPSVGSRVPIAHGYYKSRKSGLWHSRTRLNRFGVSRSTLKQASPKHVLNNDSWIYLRVISKQNIGKRVVYDLVDQPSHRFVANGLAVHNCSFCSHWGNGSYRKLVVRSIPHVIEELREVRRTYGIRAFMDYSDEVNLRPDFEEYLAAIGKEDFIWRGFFKSGRKYMTDELFEKMRAAGCVELCTGAESLDETVLRHVGKGSTVEDNLNFVRLCKRHKIRPKVFLQIGLPYESKDSVANTKRRVLDLVEEVGPFDLDFTITMPYHGTPIWEQPSKFDFVYDKKELDFGGEKPVYYKSQPGTYTAWANTSSLTRAEIVELRDDTEREIRAKMGLPPLMPEEAEGTREDPTVAVSPEDLKSVSP